MIGPTEPARSTFPSTKQALVILVAGSVVLAFAGLILFLALEGGNSRATLEVYNYHLFVRMRNPGTSAEIWVPVPDFTELRDRTFVNETFVNSPFPSRNVTQSIQESAHGTMFRFVFSESFAVWGIMRSAPGSANGTLTFSSQVSNDVWINLANITPDNQVSFILYYEVAQVHGLLSNTEIFFVGTVDPRGGPEAALVLPCGAVYRMAYEGEGYTVLSGGWSQYPLVDGGFSESCD